ncbi:MAG: hypothetical protein HKN62_05795 [Phycisphaerales bacterium]|nr:hypothetical protein [Phycisphaerales bacterium]
MPANRSRTMQWRRCLEQIQERGGAIEIAVAHAGDDDDGAHLIWRVRVLALSADEIVVEQPAALGQIVHIRDGIELVAILTVGQNRWMFTTSSRGVLSVDDPRRPTRGLRLVMPSEVQRCQRRHHRRVDTARLLLPQLDVWPLLDPKSAVLAERACELAFARGPETDAEEPGPSIRPELGPRFTASLVNLGGGGVGLEIGPEHSQIVCRHKVYWIQIPMPGEPAAPICASAKLVHTHMQSDHSIYAGLAFDFTFNAPHQRFVADQICRYVSRQQEAARVAQSLRKSA